MKKQQDKKNQNAADPILKKNPTLPRPPLKINLNQQIHQNNFNI